MVEAIEISPPTFDEEYRRNVQELLEHVAGWVESRRGLSFKERVEVVVLTKEWVIEHWGAGFLNLTKTKLEEIILKSLFVVPRDFNLTDFKVNRAGYIVAASAGNKIYVVRELFNLDNRLRAGSVLVHELTHILQGEHFELPTPSTSDERNAFDALIEGDAGLLASRYVLEHGGLVSRLAENEFDPLTALWLFPYLHGEPFVRYVYEARGWDGVNELYKDPPRSTTEILHPEKYLGGWRPIKPSLTPELDGGWRLLMQDTLGEFFIRQMLRKHLPFSIANRSAEGWCGDVIQLYERDGAYKILWKIVWENPDEADEFSRAFRELLERVGADQISENSWIIESEVVVVETSDVEVLIKIMHPYMVRPEVAVEVQVVACEVDLKAGNILSPPGPWATASLPLGSLNSIGRSLGGVSAITE